MCSGVGNEPIYENVPLPWAQESEPRSRTSSIQSAPEMTRGTSTPTPATSTLPPKAPVNNDSAGRNQQYIIYDKRVGENAINRVRRG